VLGDALGTARLIGLIILSIITGLIMAFLFHKEENESAGIQSAALPAGLHEKNWWVQVIFFGLLVAVMIMATSRAWLPAGISAAVLVAFFLKFFDKDDFSAWMSSTYEFVKRILPWVLVGVAGALLIVVFLPTGVVVNFVGGNSITSCFKASLVGSLLYLCPPSEVLYTKAFSDLSMGAGPSLSFILTAPAVSLPSMVVLFRILGGKKTITYIGLLIALTTLFGFIFGIIAG
jgi:hypothetical protein